MSKVIKRRTHLDSSKQPKEGWRTIPFNALYEAHPSGLIRNKNSKRLIKGTMTRKSSKFKSHEIIYLLHPYKTTYSRARVIARTFPDKVQQYNSRLDKGYVCHIDGNPSNCSVDNLFISSGKVRESIYKVNGLSYSSKDMREFVSSLVKDVKEPNVDSGAIVLRYLEKVIKNEGTYESGTGTLYRKEGKEVYITLPYSSVLTFTLDKQVYQEEK